MLDDDPLEEENPNEAKMESPTQKSVTFEIKKMITFD